jgi:hypothetical protein
MNRLTFFQPGSLQSRDIWPENGIFWAQKTITNNIG